MGADGLECSVRDAPGRRDPAWISGAFVAAAQLAQPTGRQEGPPSGAARACRIPYSARVSGNPALGVGGSRMNGGWRNDESGIFDWQGLR